MQASELHITPVLNGFVVRVGCQTIVFDTIEKLTTQIGRYYKDPETVSKEFISAAVNKMNALPPPAAQCETAMIHPANPVERRY